MVAIQGVPHSLVCVDAVGLYWPARLEDRCAVACSAASLRLRAPSLVVRRRGDGIVLTSRAEGAAGTLPALRCAAAAADPPADPPVAAAAATGPGAAPAAVPADGGRNSAQPSTCRICHRSAALRLHRNLGPIEDMLSDLTMHGVTSAADVMMGGARWVQQGAAAFPMIK